MIPLRDISLEGLTAYLKKHARDYDRILGFRPTGWTYAPAGGVDTSNALDIKSLLARDRKATFDARDLRPMRGSSDKIMMFGVPYSEHSFVSLLLLLDLDAFPLVSSYY
jgi:DNA cross-link repair 1A protein